MNYFTAMASSPVFEFPYSGSQAPLLPNVDTNIDALLASIAQPLGPVAYNPLPTITLQCTPQINTGVGMSNNTLVYQVPEDMSVDAILQQFGINTTTLQPSNTFNSYYRSASQPMEIILPPVPQHRRRLVCHEVSESEDDNYRRRSPSHHRNRRHSLPNESPGAIHNVLGRVWEKAREGSQDLPTSSSAPNINSMWQSMRNSTSPPPQSNFAVNNAWQAMRNATPPMSQAQQNAVSNVWNKANFASNQNASRISNAFNRMRQAPGSIIAPPPQPPPNREAVQDFFAARNVPYGVNLPPPPQPQFNREAVQDFFAARNLPYGINLPPPQPQPNREAVQDFFAARNLPYGINLPPTQPQPNREAVQDFFAARNLPYGINLPPTQPQPNREAVQDFFAARNLPYGINLPPTQPQPNREAVQDFFAARNLPYGINSLPPPQQNREAVQDFFAARNLPYGINSLPPQQNREAVQDFFAARNIPYGANQSPAVANVWNMADRAINQSPSPLPPMNPSWNSMQQGPIMPLNPSFGNPPFGAQLNRPISTPAPSSFASVLAQAHRRNLPYAGSM